jgi:hypothetical protein
MKTPEILRVFFLSSIIVLVSDILTNSLDTQKNAWVFFYYITLLWLKMDFIMPSRWQVRLRIVTLFHDLSLLGMTIERGFGFIAYFGAIA